MGGNSLQVADICPSPSMSSAGRLGTPGLNTNETSSLAAPAKVMTSVPNAWPQRPATALSYLFRFWRPHDSSATYEGPRHRLRDDLHATPRAEINSAGRIAMFTAPPLFNAPDWKFTRSDSTFDNDCLSGEVIPCRRCKGKQQNQREAPSGTRYG